MFFPFTKKLNYIKLQLLLRYYFFLFLSILKITLNSYFKLKNITFICVYTYFNLLHRESLFFQPQKTKKSDQHNFYVVTLFCIPLPRNYILSLSNLSVKIIYKNSHLSLLKSLHHLLLLLQSLNHLFQP